MSPFFAIIPTPGFAEIVVILVVGLLLFGSRLPEVGRSLGKGLMELRRGMQGLRDEVYDLDREADRRVDEEIRRRDRERARLGPEGGAAVEVEPDPLDAELARRDEERRAVEPVEYCEEVRDEEPTDDEPPAEAERREGASTPVVETGPGPSRVEDVEHHLHPSPEHDASHDPAPPAPSADPAPDEEPEERPHQP